MTGCSRIRVENADILRGGKSQLRVPYLRKIAEQEGARSKNENFVRSCICYLPPSSSASSSSRSSTALVSGVCLAKWLFGSVVAG